MRALTMAAAFVVLCAAPHAVVRQAPAVAAGDLAVDVRSRAVKPGEILAITVRAAAPLSAIAVTLGDRPVPVWRDSPTTWRGLAGLDVEQAPGPVALKAGGTPAGGPALARTVTLQVDPASFVERTLTVPPRYVDPPASARPRIEREAKRLHAIYEIVSDDRTPGPFAAPVPQRRSSPFGARSIFNGVPRERHGGLDFASPAGTVIRAPSAGKVVLVGPLYFTGNTVVLDHGRGLYSVLAHMQRTMVREGQVVLQGARLGTVGMTGRATGPHLHWTVRLGGTRVDPAAVLDVLGVAAAP
jgi:murein DD-endopeptidase MepM/ murein hydrolase activator NlpD